MKRSANYLSCFNSMIVRLKVRGFAKAFPLFFSFNSMIVRLKDSLAIAEAVMDVSFNSMIVRLKVGTSGLHFNESPTFQFYDSPIKRVYPRVVQGKRFRFQFYDTPIKSLFFFFSERHKYLSFNSMIVRLKVCVKSVILVLTLMFQFYDSPIKSPTNTECLRNF